MAYTNLGPTGFLIPTWYAEQSTSLTAVTGLTATGEKIALMGAVQTPNGGSKSIRKVHLLLGTVVKAGGSALTLSLQDLSTAANIQPDETQDETVAIGNAALASNTWLTTGNLSADRSINHGDPLAVVLEFDGAGRLGADTIGFSLKQRASALNSASILPTVNRKSGGTWTRPSNGYGNTSVLFEFSDGTFGTFAGSAPISAAGTTAYNSGSSPNEYALRWNMPFKCKVNGLVVVLSVSSTSLSTFDLVLYQGTTAVVSRSIHPRTWSGANNEVLFTGFAEAELLANTDYYFAVKPTSTNNVQLTYVDVANANYMAAMPGGANLYLATRAGGAWSTNTTRRPQIYASISQIDNGAGGGGVPSGFGTPLICGGIVQ